MQETPTELEMPKSNLNNFITCQQLLNIPNDVIPDVAADFNFNFDKRHPERIKTISLSLQNCFLQALKRYLASKVIYKFGNCRYFNKVSSNYQHN